MAQPTPTPVLRDTRSFRPFKSSEEYLYAMKEDLAEWLNMLYPELYINVDNFMDRLDTGVALCKHANKVRAAAEEYVARRQARRLSMSTSTTTGSLAIPVTLHGDVHYLEAAKPGTFFARDNVSNFIAWCRRALGVFEVLLFETDDLILRKNEKHVILTLLDVARRGARLGMLAPMLVCFEREIDREIAAENRGTQQQGVEDDSDDELELLSGPQPQIVTNDLKSLDEMVRDLVERCQCPVQFPMIRVSEGKYRIGDTKVLIFVRVLRKHVMVRVGGGWDTLSHYLDKHDPCRCKTAHRSPLSAKLILKNAGALELGSAQVHYERSPPRTRRSSASSISSGGGGGGCGGGCGGLTATPTPARSRSPTPRRSMPSNSLHAPRPASSYGGSTEQLRGRSRSPTPTPTLSRPPSRRHSALIPDNNNATPAVTPAAEQQLNDSGSEVSDEGYRSLGTVIVSPPATGDGLPPKILSSEGDTPRKETEETEIPDRPIEHDSSTDSVISEDKVQPPALPEIPRKPSSVTSSPQHKRSLPVPGSHEILQHQRKLSQPPPSTTTPKTNTPMTRSRSTCGDDSGFIDSPVDLSPRRTSVYNRSMRGDPRVARQPISGVASLGRATGKQALAGTWSGSRQGINKPKTRPVLTDTTFSNTNNIAFGRSSPQRRSLGAYGSAHSSPSRSNNNPARRQHKGSLPSSLQTSPTRQISPLIEEILQVKELDNDATVLQKMRELIQQYADIVDTSADRSTDLPQGEDEMDFTSAWVHGNGSLDGIQQVRRKGSCASVPGDLGSTSDLKLGIKASPNPRKDSKADGGTSRIPIPVFFGPQDS